MDRNGMVPLAFAFETEPLTQLPRATAGVRSASKARRTQLQ
jgi:hypothetical protein